MRQFSYKIFCFSFVEKLISCLTWCLRSEQLLSKAIQKLDTSQFYCDNSSNETKMKLYDIPNNLKVMVFLLAAKDKHIFYFRNWHGNWDLFICLHNKRVCWRTEGFLLAKEELFCLCNFWVFLFFNRAFLHQNIKTIPGCMKSFRNSVLYKQLPFT